MDPPGTILDLPGDVFHDIVTPPADMFNAALCAKLMQTYDRNRSTCLFSFCMWINFYMWISTATDSRSRSTNPCMHTLTVLRLGVTQVARVLVACDMPENTAQGVQIAKVTSQGGDKPS